mmetsp:Transcript_17492/g.59433  ORF Transcript_17492/g.59433 Transcript_17492/m.59433 type:complete len:234 (+) Transcript_17492:456-1157(+)
MMLSAWRSQMPMTYVAGTAPESVLQNDRTRWEYSSAVLAWLATHSLRTRFRRLPLAPPLSLSMAPIVTAPFTTSIHPRSWPVLQHPYVTTVDSNPASRHMPSMTARACRAIWSCRRSSPALKMTGVSSPSAVANVSHSGFLALFITRHFAGTMRSKLMTGESGSSHSPRSLVLSTLTSCWSIASRIPPPSSSTAVRTRTAMPLRYSFIFHCRESIWQWRPQWCTYAESRSVCL